MTNKTRFLRILTAAISLLSIVLLQVNIAWAYISDGGAAVSVVGAVNTNSPYNLIYTSGASNNGEGSTNARGLSAPQEVEVDTTNHRLFVSDSGNHRVLVFKLMTDNKLDDGADSDSDPTTDLTADYVLGQTNFTGSSADTSSTKLFSPMGLHYDNTNTRLFVSDYGNSRVLVYNVSTIDNGEEAINVLGQPDFTTNTTTTTQVGLSYPRGLVYNSTTSRLFVADYANNRIVSYDLSDGISNGESAENVLGQSSWTSSTAATSQAGLQSPSGIEVDSSNNRLFVGDYLNHRVIIYDIASITNGENAANILGQSSWTSDTSATSTTGLYNPYGVAYDSGDNRLFVTSAGNHRTTVYNLANGLTNNEAAVNVLGQADFTSSSSSGASQSTLLAPYGASYENGNDYIYSIDSGNHRVMVFDAAVDPGSSSTPEFSTITFLAALLIGVYALHRKKMSSTMHA